MNIFSVIGLCISTSVLFIGMRLSSDNLKIFLDYPSIFIVVGGTFAATAVSFQLNRMLVLFKIFFLRIIKGKKYDYSKTIIELMQISEAYRKGEALNALSNKVVDPFLKECIDLYDEGVLENDSFYKVIEERSDNMMNTYSEEARRIKSVSKFPPAFGMMGTTIGMIVLLANLGGEDALKMIGPAMGVCLITTLYGVALANLVFVPVSENLVDNAKEIYLKNQMVVAGVKMLVHKTNPIVVAINLNSFLTPSERVDWKEVLGK